ncbi:MAG: 23S rRNA (adenine(2503)-C(2))-methyltransferase RlmN [Oscillospiraceae bacterium]|nr:23S rRNA (adenine(2503)-C(2))-methyltransferase RlmN [Oscillospiraceae bacterium]
MNHTRDDNNLPPEDIKSMTLEELAQEVAAMGLPPFRAKQIYAWIQQRGAESFGKMTDLSASLRAALAEKFEIFPCAIEKRLVSEYNETVKYLFKLRDGEMIEAVLMKYKYGHTLCVSSQAGCKMGCAFCASARCGFARNLTASEMLGQIHAAQKDRQIRVSHVVLMGMGEPLDNFENVNRFLELVSFDPGLNIGMRNISLSTCGLVPQIYELMEKKLQLTLSVSLHAPNDEIRSRLMPVNRRYPVDTLLKACRDYVKATGRRISFEYIMISGVNDSGDCAKELAAKLKGMLCHVNLIPANEFTDGGFKRSGGARVEAFSAVLSGKGINVTLRRSLGGDIDAACGQLRKRN